MRAADTNVLVRLITRDDPKQTHAAEAFIESGAWIPHIVLVETVWVLEAVYDRGRPAITQAVEMLLNHHSLSIQDRETVSAALEQFRAWPRVGFSDCLALEISRRAGHLPLGTFDRQLSKLPDVARVS